MIKFITEEYLRNLYKKEAFDTYELKQGQRLTPGAKEYLSDKRVKLIYDSSETKSNTCNGKKSQVNNITYRDAVSYNGNTYKENNENYTDKVNKGNKDLEDESVQINSKEEVVKQTSKINSKLQKKLYYKLKSIEALFLVTSNEVLKIDVILAHNIVNLSRKLGNLKNFVIGKSNLEAIICSECSKINSCNITDDLDDCFEITEFHMQLEKGSAILKMHSLRCKLQELQCEIEDIYEDTNDVLKYKVIENINAIINLLSQLICTAVGGKECQRKI